MKKARDDEKCYTVKEVRALLRALDREEHAKLAVMARDRARVSANLDAGDLLNEAIVRFLDGRRGWPRGIDALRMLDQAMKSIASADLKHQNIVVDHAEIEEATHTERLANERGRSTMVDELHAERLLQRIVDELSSDQEALAIAMGRAEGLDGPEIRRRFNLGHKEYEAARKRCGRKIAKIVSEDDEHER